MNTRKSVREVVIKLKKMGINVSLSKPRLVMVKQHSIKHKSKGVNQ